ncbi:MAG TPA: GTP-binding protein, partial [bacterium]|nr:GTP-binding protein [bacterium]
MKGTPTEKIRNIVLCGSRSSGKTQLAEALLFKSGVGTRMNLVDKGNSIMDYTPEEIDRKMSMNLSVAALNWKDHKINLIDTPGDMDFVGDMITGIFAADVVCLNIHAEEGPGVSVFKAWEFAKKFRKPAFIFINALDKNPKIDAVLARIKDEITLNAAPVAVPDGSGKITRVLLEKEHPMKEPLLEVIASSSDSLTEKYLEQGTLSEEEIRSGFKKGILEGKIVPVLSGSGLAEIGTAELLDFMAEYLPDPGETEAEPPVRKNDPLRIQVFKIVYEGHMGEVAYMKLFSGHLKQGDDILNINQNSAERMGQIYFPQGKNRTEAEDIQAGDIFCALKLKATSVFNTLGKEKNLSPLPPVEYPHPVVWMGVYATVKGEEEKMANSFQA